MFEYRNWTIIFRSLLQNLFGSYFKSLLQIFQYINVSHKYYTVISYIIHNTKKKLTEKQFNIYIKFNSGNRPTFQSDFNTSKIS